MSDAATDAAIAAAWPKDWAKANDARPGASKRRNKLRKAWAAQQSFAAFKAANPNANCGNCAHRGNHYNIGDHCELQTDFYGYATIRDLSKVCVQHEPTPPDRPA
ncbi:hypothetical protein [Sphingobium abikonense]|uniref:hypothetical protein n=1 Tax=Sphingobium abikonense TaxID=86193 RepID=UPI003517014A